MFIPGKDFCFGFVLIFFLKIYIVKYGNLNEEFDKKTMIDILNSVVIPDLKSFDKYVEGVIEIPDNDKSCFTIYHISLTLYS